MATIASLVTAAALIGALTSFIVGARVYLRAAGPDGHGLSRPLVIVWPFLFSRIRPLVGDRALLNKCIVALMSCLMIAVATGSLATNLHRLAR